MRLKVDTSFQGASARVWQGDAFELLKSLEPASVSLIISSPPYFMGKEYDKSHSHKDFLAQHRRLMPLLTKALKPGGSLCWQVGNHVRDSELVPLDFLVLSAIQPIKSLVLRNRIVWTFNHGVHCKKRFSGRYETILWFTKGGNFTFNLDAIRVPQRYPGKRHYKGPNKGAWSGNPLGKNPGDVWEIPNVKAKHVEKTAHPCQFPAALAARLIRALSDPGDLVLDPFLGSGTTCVAALSEHRSFVGSEISGRYVQITRERIDLLMKGRLQLRPDMPIRAPSKGEAVATAPPHFAVNLWSA